MFEIRQNCKGKVNVITFANPMLRMGIARYYRVAKLILVWFVSFEWNSKMQSSFAFQ